MLLLFVIGIKDANALLPGNLRLIPTATPTSSTIKLGTSLRLIPTATPTLTLIKLPTLKLKPLGTITPTESPTPTEEITPTENPTLTPTATIQPTTTNPGGNDMTFWFLVVTIGLLAVIIVVQAWPKKNDEE
jgi:hypothetical protein